MPRGPSSSAKQGCAVYFYEIDSSLTVFSLEMACELFSIVASFLLNDFC